MNVIYGAGHYGKLMLNFLHKRGTEIEAFCQTKSDGRLEYCGLPLINLEELAAKKDIDTIYIAIYNREISRGIKENLMDLSVAVMVLECGEFIRYNIAEERAVTITYPTPNPYEESVAISYWQEYFSDEEKLHNSMKTMKNGLSDQDSLRVDKIVERMRKLPFQDGDSDIFTKEEKQQMYILTLGHRQSGKMEITVPA